MDEKQEKTTDEGTTEVVDGAKQAQEETIIEPSEEIQQAVDGRVATHLVREYFQEIHGNWMLMFKIQKVERNTDPGVWKINCSFFTSPGQSKPLEYFVKVNVKNGSMVQVEELN